MQKSSDYIHMLIQVLKIENCIPALHSPLGPGTIRAGHMQATDRLGKESVTTHVWLGEQGFPTVHGFWHSSLMQANLDGQSASTLHSGWGPGSYAKEN